MFCPESFLTCGSEERNPFKFALLEVSRLRPVRQTFTFERTEIPGSGYWPQISPRVFAADCAALRQRLERGAWRGSPKPITFAL